MSQRQALIEESKEISLVKQCGLLGISRSGIYYDHRKPTQKALLLMRAIDEQYLQTPFYGRSRDFA